MKITDRVEVHVWSSKTMIYPESILESWARLSSQIHVCWVLLYRKACHLSTSDGVALRWEGPNIRPTLCQGAETARNSSLDINSFCAAN